ncbi:hypothetical protein BDV11DRAFT_214779 [Aspergillus similis]
MSKISLFGLGAMGQALAHRYIDAGYTTTVWNRTPEKAQSSGLIQKGAHQALTVAEGLEAADLETLSKAVTSLTGRIIVNLTNGTPAQARDLSEWATEHGAAYIHGGIKAVPDMISSGSPHSVLLYSGRSVEVFNRIEPDLARLGAAKFLSTDPGSASLHDLALLSGKYGLFSGFFHSTALVRSQPGTTAEGFLELLTPWLGAMTHYLGALAKQIDSGEYATQGSNIAMQVAGVENIIAASEEVGVTPAFILPIQKLMKRAAEEGYGTADVSAVIEYMRARE